MTGVPDPSHPWERQPGETAKAWEAFRLYRELGPGRTLAEVARQSGKFDSQIARWSTANTWRDRIAALEAHLERDWLDQVQAERTQAARRQLRLAQGAQATGIRWLQDVQRRVEHPTKKNAAPDDAVMLRLLMASLDLERKVLGVNDTPDAGAITTVLIDSRLFPDGAQLPPDGPRELDR